MSASSVATSSIQNIHCPKENVQLKNLLDILNIKKLVFIDDKLKEELSIENVLDYSKVIFDLNKKDVLEVSFEMALPDNKDVVEKVLKEKIADLNNDKRISLVEELKDEIKDLYFDDNPADDLLAFKKLEKYLEGTGVEYLPFVPAEWDSKKTTILSDVNEEEKLLILFDKELGDGKDSNFYIDEIISNNTYDGLIYCGVFTHSINSAKEEWDLFEGEYEKNPKFYPISKSRIANIDKFLHGLKLVLGNLYSNSLKNRYKDSILTANSEAIKKIENLDINHFDQIIFKSSISEGVLVEDTFKRLFNLFHNEELMTIIKKDKEILELNKLLKKINSIKYKPTKEFRDDIRKIRKKELYLESDFLNNNHLPLKPGDIFKINSKTYILLAQSCDLMVRSYGGRKLTEGYLVEIVKANETLNGLIGSITKSLKKVSNIESEEDKIIKNELEHIKGKVNNLMNSERYYKLELFNSGQDYFLDFGSCFSVNLLPLDLCCINSDGKSIFVQNSPFKVEKSISIGFENLIENISKKLNKVEKESDLPNLFLSNKIKGSYDEEGSKIQYPVVRVKRLRNLLISDILIKFSNKISRIGFEHDISRE